MTLPIAGTVYVYNNNKETFNALHNLHTKEIISNVDNLKDLPIREVGRKSQRASDIVLEILHELVKGNETMIQEVRQVVHNALVPIKDVAELLNSDVRGNVQTILQKVRLILGTVHDRDIRESIRILKQAMKDFESTSIQIKKAIHHDNINRTMNLVADADRTMKKMDALVSKFVG
tara:strand:+ start:105 stop:632 length:528 start_codon:yes stop_codon:yes gene_type:complete